jgi:dTMP kinase
MMRIPKLTFSDRQFSGVLIVFCGLDGSGKTTLIERLTSVLKARGIEPIKTKQPTDQVRQSPLFQRVMYTPDFFSSIEYRAHSLVTVSDRIQHSLRFILPELDNGKVVISDRYFFSAITNLRARGYTEDRWIYELANHLPRPDLSFFCEAPFDLILQRLSRRPNEKNRFFDVDFNRRLYDEFVSMRSNYLGAITLDTSQSLDRTGEEMQKNVDDVLRKKFGRTSAAL